MILGDSQEEWELGCLFLTEPYQFESFSYLLYHTGVYGFQSSGDRETLGPGQYSFSLIQPRSKKREKGKGGIRYCGGETEPQCQPTNCIYCWGSTRWTSNVTGGKVIIIDTIVFSLEESLVQHPCPLCLAAPLSWQHTFSYPILHPLLEEYIICVFSMSFPMPLCQAGREHNQDAICIISFNPTSLLLVLVGMAGRTLIPPCCTTWVRTFLPDPREHFLPTNSLVGPFPSPLDSHVSSSIPSFSRTVRFEIWFCPT